MEIRAARPDELVGLQDIENASGEPFRAIGMPEIADDDPLPLSVLTHLSEAGQVWVAVDGEAVAWVAVEVVDGCAHIEQISVHPDHARRGIGARLIDHVESWARDRGLAAVTLTTFRDVPWNGPYYERLGFHEITALTPGLADVVAQETARGLDPSARLCQRRNIG